MGLVEEFLAQMTPEEREQHKKLIAECQTRANNLEATREYSLEMLADFSCKMNTMAKTVKQAGENCSEVGEALDNIHSHGHHFQERSQEFEDNLADINLHLAHVKFEEECRADDSSPGEDSENESADN